MGNSLHADSKEQLRRAQQLLEGSDRAAPEPAKAVALLEGEAKKGNKEAMWMLAACCEYGLGTEKNTARAEHLYSAATHMAKPELAKMHQQLASSAGRGSEKMLLVGALRRCPHTPPGRKREKINWVVEGKTKQERASTPPQQRSWRGCSKCTRPSRS